MQILVKIRTLINFLRVASNVFESFAILDCIRDVIRSSPLAKLELPANTLLEKNDCWCLKSSPRKSSLLENAS